MFGVSIFHLLNSHNHRGDIFMFFFIYSVLLLVTAFLNWLKIKVLLRFCINQIMAIFKR